MHAKSSVLSLVLYDLLQPEDANQQNKFSQEKIGLLQSVSQSMYKFAQLWTMGALSTNRNFPILKPFEKKAIPLS